MDIKVLKDPNCNDYIVIFQSQTELDECSGLLINKPENLQNPVVNQTPAPKPIVESA